MSAPAHDGDGRLALFMPDLHGGGAERVMLTLAGGFAARGRTVDLVLVRVKGHYLAEIPDGVRIVDLRAKKSSTSALALAAYLRRHRPRALLSTLNHANVVAVVARRLARVNTRTVVRQANMLTPALEAVRPLMATVVLAAMRRAYPRADEVVAVSADVASDISRLIRLAPGRVRVIPNPVVTPELFALAREAPDHPWMKPGEPPVIVSLGRLTAQKDYPTLLRAFAQAGRGRCRLLILGEGEERPALERLVRELGIEAAVSLPGFVKNPFAYLARAAAFVSSSVYEGSPGAVVQALACGAAVVATDCPGGSRDALGDGRFGQLVPVGDAAAMAEAIGRALEGTGATTAPEAWSRFSFDSSVDQYLGILERGAT